jgi:formylmethanofuran:tetrahydromethanopterin formyltransferase
LASGAGSLLGLEFEGVAPEDQEFEVAKGLVQMAGTAIQNAAQSPAVADPQAAAKSAVIAAAKAHVPGLLQPQATPGTRPGRRPRSGKWYRRGGRIVLVGV